MASQVSASASVKVCLWSGDFSAIPRPRQPQDTRISPQLRCWTPQTASRTGSVRICDQFKNGIILLCGDYDLDIWT